VTSLYSTRATRVGAIGLAIGILATTVALAEATLRIYARMSKPFGRLYAGLDVLAVKIEPHGTIGFRPKPHSTFEYGNGTIARNNAMRFRGPTVAIPKPPNTFRIVLLGESTTYGWGVNDEDTIDAYMRRLLPQRYPGLRFDVVNLAFDGYDSYQLVERLRTDGVPLDPDLLIVHAGINDVRNAQFANLQDPDPRTFLYDGILSVQRERQRHGRYPLLTRLKHVSYVARLPELVSGEIVAARSAEVRRTRAPNPAASEFFGRNLRRIVALVRPRSVPILFSATPSALAVNFEPDETSTISYWLANAAVTEAYRLSLTDRMTAVVRELRRELYPASFVSHDIPGNLFLDDCHLTPEGNRRVAQQLVDAAEPYITARRRQEAGRGHPAGRPSREVATIQRWSRYRS
jgi:lysophospholipase L1-like esterase